MSSIGQEFAALTNDDMGKPDLSWLDAEAERLLEEDMVAEAHSQRFDDDFLTDEEISAPYLFEED